MVVALQHYFQIAFVLVRLHHLGSEIDGYLRRDAKGARGGLLFVRGDIIYPGATAAVEP